MATNGIQMSGGRVATDLPRNDDFCRDARRALMSDAASRAIFRAHRDRFAHATARGLRRASRSLLQLRPRRDTRGVIRQFLIDLSLPAVVAGFVAVLVGFTS